VSDEYYEQLRDFGDGLTQVGRNFASIPSRVTCI